MKISIVTPQFYPIVSGVPRLLTDFARKMSKKHKVTVYTLNHDNPKILKKDNLKNIQIIRCPYVKLPFRFYYSPQLYKELLKGDFDIIHSHHYGYYPATAGMKAAVKKEVPHIFSTYFHPPTSSFLVKIPFFFYNLFFGKPLFRKSSKILAFSDYEKELLTKFGAPENKIHKFPNPVDTSFFRPCAKKDKNPKTVVFLHRMTKHKGADKLFKIAREMIKERNDVQFIFGGKGPLQSMENQLSSKEKRKIKFLGFVPEKEIPKLYSKGMVVVIPSKYESFSLVLAESMACGTPVISTKVGAVPELVKSDDCGFLVEYGDWQKMKEKIAYLLDNERIVARMSKKCREYIVKNYDGDRLSNRLIDLYKTLVS